MQGTQVQALVKELGSCTPCSQKNLKYKEKEGKKEWGREDGGVMDGPRVCHTEWSRSEREKQILHINAFMWNLEKW